MMLSSVLRPKGTDFLSPIRGFLGGGLCGGRPLAFDSSLLDIYRLVASIWVAHGHAVHLNISSIDLLP